MKSWVVAAWVLILCAPIVSAQSSEKVLNPATLKPKEILFSPFEKLDTSQIGTWAMTAHIASTIGDANFLTMDGRTYTGTNGTEYLVVDYAFSTNPGGLVSFTSYGKWLMLIEASSSYYEMYEYDANRDEAAGLFWLFLKTSTPSGPGSWMRGFRFANATGGVMKQSAPSVEVSELVAHIPVGEAPAHITVLAAEMVGDYEALRRQGVSRAR